MRRRRAAPHLPLTVLPALAALLLLAAAPLAAGHAVLLESEPAPGSRLDHAPVFVRVRLTEPVDESGTRLLVYDQDGNRVDAGDLAIEPGPRPLLTVTLVEVGDGAYAARWVALSTVDGHVTSGTVGFAVGGFQPPGSDGGDVAASDPASALARALAFVGMSLVLAAVALRLLPGLLPAPRDATGRWLASSGALVHLAGVTLLLADARNDAGLASGVFLATDVGAVLGPRLALAAGAAVLAVVWHLRPVRSGPWIVALLVAAAGLLSARLGHASQAGAAAVTLDWLHLMASALWVGGLVALAEVLRRPARHGLDDDALVQVGLRFSTLAMTAVVLIVATGVALVAWILGPDALAASWLGSAWGIVLVGKWVLLAAMLALAVRHRVRHIGRADMAAPALLRSVGLETALGVGVLVLAGILTSLGVPQEEAVPGATYNAQGDELFGSLTVRPAPVAGASSDLVFYVAGDDGPVIAPDCGREDCLRVLVAGQGDPPQTFFPVAEDGTWRVPDLVWTEAGPHDVVLEVQTATIYLDTLAFRFDVAAGDANDGAEDS